MSVVRRIATIGVLALTAGLTYSVARSGSLEWAIANVGRYSAPSVGSYDSLAALFLEGFYGRVVRETAELEPSDAVLDIGSGTGRLAVVLARAFPQVHVVGVDISSEMVERAWQVVGQADLSARVSFVQGEAGALPFPDASFDAVLSTLSMHHWPDRPLALAEIYRVLRPRGAARIYDVVDWIRGIKDRRSGIADLASRGPFVGAAVKTVVRLGPIPIVQRAELRKGASAS